jgi:membrane carboxypeptidase/penicillin-binding protein PbpC
MTFVFLFKKFPKLFLKNKKRILVFIALVFMLLLAAGSLAKGRLLSDYRAQFSVLALDRNGKTIMQYPNQKGHYLREETKMPDRLKELVVRKEDRFFYYHFGANPFSMARAFFSIITTGRAGGSSTITEQLAKVLLGHEQERTAKNKITELFYAVLLELNFSKEELLDMYATSVYLGNQVQGFSTASEMYFQKPLSALHETEMISLLATLSNPSNQNPWQEKNKSASVLLAKKLGAEIAPLPKPRRAAYRFQSPLFFEIDSMGLQCKDTCATTLDAELSEKLRDILKRRTDASRERGARNGAIVVIKIPENELLAIIGSPDPATAADGAQINMALLPRPIGSTVKPFIYLDGFKNGLRPYTKVEDREYKYPTASGFPIYPKNYDGKYHGTVTLHEALSNSLNVPSVKVLEYIGLNNFYDFLDQKLAFLPIQNYDSYQYGIALGGLEMDLATLTHYFTLFPNKGILSPLSVMKGGGEMTKSIPPQSHIENTREIASEEYAELVNKILSDRKTGVEQFGIESDLNLTQKNYALKTGTSRDFHDSWVVGYTPDFVVGVWVGNSENKPMRQVSGASGAGAIWREAMELLFTTPYNKKTPFNFEKLRDFPTKNSLEYGLAEDVYARHENLLEGKTMILAPHDGDTYEFEKGMIIHLTARKNVAWQANGEAAGEGTDAKLYPKHAGSYMIEAVADNGVRESLKVIITLK